MGICQAKKRLHKTACAVRNSLFHQTVFVVVFLIGKLFLFVKVILAVFKQTASRSVIVICIPAECISNNYNQDQQPENKPAHNATPFLKSKYCIC